MKISLKKIVENVIERDPSLENSEARKLLILFRDHNGYGCNSSAWKSIFSEYNENVAKSLIDELISGGWLKKDYINHLDQGLFITDKAEKILSIGSTKKN